MSNPFFDHPILNSPYEYPARHWELDAHGPADPANHRGRRRAEFITPIPKPKKRKAASGTAGLVFDEGKGLSTEEQQYDPTSIINEVRQRRGRLARAAEPEPLAGHARDGAAAPALAAPRVQRRPPVLLPDRGGRDGHLADRGRAARPSAASESSSTSPPRTTTPTPSCMRLALKLATGAGKTTVMAMLIAWQTDQRRPPTPAASTSPAASSSSRPA